MEKITVKGFAGLKDVVFEPRKITLLIGPQASGKSVLTKLTYFFRSIWPILLSPYESSAANYEESIEAVKSTFRKYFPPSTWGRKVFSLQYEVAGHKIYLRRSPSRGKPSQGLIITLPDFVKKLSDKQNSLIESKRKIKKAKASARHRFMYEAWISTQNELTDILAGSYFSGQLFIPAARAFFSNVENNVFSFIARSEKMLDPFISQFGEYYNFMKIDLLGDNPEEVDLTFLSKSLNGRLVVERDSEYVVMTDGRRIPVSNLSSGQQELLPLLISLAQSNWFLEEGDSRSLYIEEPEAHLFPEYQRIVLDYIVSSMNNGKQFRNLIITTHSPYLLSALNNLILAYQVGKRRRGKYREMVEGLVPKNQWLNPDELSAYAMMNGSVRNIIDSELGLVDASYIDEVSTNIAKTFDGLLDLY